MPIVSGGGGGGGLGGVTLSGSAAASKTIVASGASAAAWQLPPGYEVGYDQITASVNVVSTTEATGTTIIAAAAHTFDGAPVICEFFTEALTVGGLLAEIVIVSLFESSTQITRLAAVDNNSANTLIVPVYARYRFTPSAASHTYTVTAHTTSVTGTPSVGAGSGGTGAPPPCFVRFTKV